MVKLIAIFMLVSVAKAQKNLSTANRSCGRETLPGKRMIRIPTIAHSECYKFSVLVTLLSFFPK
jgi:hypothetical protein